MDQNSVFNFYSPKLNEAIAIVGMACRFPGANNYDEFWQNLERGISSITEIPAGRWDTRDIYSPLPNQPYKSISKWGGFIEGIDRFDANFFGISPREAQKMDPQQRLMLELSWTCLEDAGYSPTELSGASVGVFMGMCNGDYDHLMHWDEENTDGHSGTGIWVCFTPNRISAYLNVNGPSLSIDTACSSSLVAIHQAANAIKDAECEMALVGGISVLCTSMRYIQMSQQAMLSPVGLCKTFDSQADGYVRGEGAGVILLKPYKNAIADGDRIYGVIKGSAVNHGGKARTLTSPNVYAQAKVIRSALAKANIDPDTISYIEAHGTGTPLGDPIEINALVRAFKQASNSNGKRTNYCGLGTVKTNIGHLEPASGIAGVIKVLLAMQYRKLPPIVNFQQLNPRIKLKGSPFYIVLETQDWEPGKTSEGREILRRCGVSSFGIGGTNAHVVLEEAPVQVKSQTLNVKSKDSLERPVHLLTLSAKTEKALQELSDRYQQHLETHSELELADICYTANTGRAHFDYRLAVIATNKQELAEKLQHYKTSEQITGLFWGQTDTNTPKIAFLFTGQGSQYVNMGRQLYQEAPVFRETLDRCDAILRSELEPPLLDILYPKTTDESSSSLLDQTAYTQPALFSLEYALAKLWQSWGIKPDVVMGHSVGEYVAATLAGVLSLEEGLKLIAARGRLMQQLPAGGRMVSAMTSEENARSLITPYTERVAIAAINGPESTVISGAAEAIEAIVGNLESVGIKTKQLQVSHAFHSPLMDPILAEFEEIANQLTYHQPEIPLISNLTGVRADSRITTANYWSSHIRQPVRFYQSMQTLHELGYQVFLEVGPKPVLLGMGRECLLGTKAKNLWLTSLRPGKQDWLQLLQSLGQLYVRGIQVDWSGFDKDYPHQKVALPTYPWQRQRYWITDLDNTKQKAFQISEIRPTPTQETRTPQPRKIALSDLQLVALPQDSYQKQKNKRQLVELAFEPDVTVKLQSPRSSFKNNPKKLKTETRSILIEQKIDSFQLKETLKEKLAEALYVDVDEIDEDQKFIDLGLDSIIGVEWIAIINKTYGLEIKATKLYDYPTLMELTEHIAQVLSSEGKTEIVSQQHYQQRLEPSVSSQVNISEIKQVLKKRLAEVLYVDINEIEEDQKFIDLGLDSIIGVEWISTINKTYGLKIKATKLYDYPTLLELAGYVAQEISQTRKTLLLQENEARVNKISEGHRIADEPGENLRKQLRSILNKVARNELTIQGANQMIQKLKQGTLERY